MKERIRQVDDATRQKIMAAINEASDDGQRAMLLLLLEISAKIDAVLTDERTLKDLVLNGSSAYHDDDHKWLRDARAKGSDCEKMLTTHQGGGGHCLWAVNKMAEEKADSESRHRLVYEWLGKVLWVCTIFMAGVVGSKFFGM